MGKITIKKTCETETAHIVRHAVSERCRYNVHGHSYRWEIGLCSTDGSLDYSGMVKDFGDLKALKAFIDLFDHTTVLWSNEDALQKQFFMENYRRVIIMEKNPTAENMAKLLHNYITAFLENQGITRNLTVTAGVWETRTGYAEADFSEINDVVQTYSDELLTDLHDIMETYWEAEA